MSRRFSVKKLEAEVHELRKFKQMAENFLAEHGLKDYFRKVFIHSNNQELQEQMVLETDKDRLTEKEKLMNITLDATQQKELKKTLKCGI